MPVYCYKCIDCSCEFEIKHKMSFDSQLCVKCNSENVFKIPALLDKKSQVFSLPRTGAIVDEYIKDTKEEIKKEKKNMKSREV